MAQWKVILATLLIFGSGLFAGNLLHKAPRTVKPPEKPGQKRALPWEWAARAESLQRMEQDLKLTPAQREKIGTILADGHKRSRAIAEPLFTKMREEGQKVRDQIRAELTPEQVKRFDTPPRGPGINRGLFPPRGSTNDTNFFKKFPKEKRPDQPGPISPPGDVRPEPSPKKD
jgi:Spy/CpxP family protein refolding chaperone